MSAPLTESHKALWTNLYNLAFLEIFDDFIQSSDSPAHQLIADSEAEAVQTAMLREYGDLCATNESLAKERDQLRAENITFRAAQKICADCDAPTNEEVAKLRAEVERLKADGAASAFINMSCRASRAEAELAAERARLDWLEKQEGGFCHTKWGEYLNYWGPAFPTKLRAAIDAAMKEGA
jgi:hypothetical protein